MKQVKAIFLDMDGTVLREDNRMSSFTADTIASLREKGLKVFLATGRAYEEIEMLMPKNVEFDGMISSNGTRGHIQGKVLFEHDLSVNTVQNIVQQAQQSNIYYEVFPFSEPRFALKKDQDWMLTLVEGEKPSTVYESEWLSRLEAIEHKLTWRDDIPTDIGYSKMYLFHPDLTKIYKFRTQMLEQSEDLKIEVSNSTPNNVETMAYQINKGTGIQEMCDHYGIDIEETLVMGDSDNDRAMFKVGEVTVAMNNASASIKALTTHVTEYDNNQDGAAQFLRGQFLEEA